MPIANSQGVTIGLVQLSLGIKELDETSPELLLTARVQQGGCSLSVEEALESLEGNLAVVRRNLSRYRAMAGDPIESMEGV